MEGGTVDGKDGALRAAMALERVLGRLRLARRVAVLDGNAPADRAEDKEACRRPRTCARTGGLARKGRCAADNARLVLEGGLARLCGKTVARRAHVPKEDAASGRRHNEHTVDRARNSARIPVAGRHVKRKDLAALAQFHRSSAAAAATRRAQIGNAHRAVPSSGNEQVAARRGNNLGRTAIMLRDDSPCGKLRSLCGRCQGHDADGAVDPGGGGIIGAQGGTVEQRRCRFACEEVGRRRVDPQSGVP